jgi:hypothetical protein
MHRIVFGFASASPTPHRQQFGVFFESRSSNELPSDTRGSRRRTWRSPIATPAKDCAFEPVLDGQRGREVMKAFNAVVGG